MKTAAKPGRDQQRRRDERQQLAVAGAASGRQLPGSSWRTRSCGVVLASAACGRGPCAAAAGVSSSTGTPGRVVARVEVEPGRQVVRAGRGRRVTMPSCVGADEVDGLRRRARRRRGGRWRRSDERREDAGADRRARGRRRLRRARGGATRGGRGVAAPAAARRRRRAASPPSGGARAAGAAGAADAARPSGLAARREAARRADLLEPEQDHRDVVAPAGRRWRRRSARARPRAATARSREDLARTLRPRGPSRSGRRSRSGTRRRRAPGHVRCRPRRSASGPSARVMIERCGCSSASSGVSLPRRMSSSTSEWSSVRRSKLAVAQEVERGCRRRGRS